MLRNLNVSNLRQTIVGIFGPIGGEKEVCILVEYNKAIALKHILIRDLPSQ